MDARRVISSIESLPDRFIGDDARLEARFRLSIDDVVRDVCVSRDRCGIELPTGTPTAEIHTDASTWFDLDAGRLSGIEAFAQRKLEIRGSIERSLLFEPLFERPDAGAMRYTLEILRTRRARVSTLLAGDPELPPLVLVHGLGATKASWLTIVAELARHHRVIALDLPGFGASSKPMGSYTARWFARHVFDVMSVLGHDQAFVAGNSMGGRVAMEMALLEPERVSGIACLCPAAAFTKCPALWLARLARPELGFFAGRLPRHRVREGLMQLFADSGCIEDSWYEAAVDDFLDVWKSPRARMAFSAALRSIYLDEPTGERGLWTRLKGMSVPAFYIYGARDVLITHHFAKKVRKHVPEADVRVWRDCGHVPQIEFPDRTAKSIVEAFAADKRTVRAQRASKAASALSEADVG